jgi:hypothetical protein
LPGYWDPAEGGGRWRYFRLNNRSHNTLTLNDDVQRACAVVPVVRHSFSQKKSYVVADLTAAYAPHAKSVFRGIVFMDGGTVVIQDEIVWAGNERKPCWNFLTDAQITCLKENAQLTKAGKTLYARIVTPMGAEFSCRSARQKPPEERNHGYRQLRIQFQEKLEKTIICVVVSTRLNQETDNLPLHAWNVEK